MRRYSMMNMGTWNGNIRDFRKKTTPDLGFDPRHADRGWRRAHCSRRRRGRRRVGVEEGGGGRRRTSPDLEALAGAWAEEAGRRGSCGDEARPRASSEAAGSGRRLGEAAMAGNGTAAAVLSGPDEQCPVRRGGFFRVFGGEEDPDSEGSLNRHRGS